MRKTQSKAMTMDDDRESREPGERLGVPRPPAPPSVVIRTARLVPIRTPVMGSDPVDLRIADGVVTDMAPNLLPEPGDHVIDASGRWIIPGLWDQHVHLGQCAQSRSRLDVGNTVSSEQVSRLVADRVADLGSAGQESSVIIGSGSRSAIWPQQPTVDELDAVSGRHPVVLISGDAHNGWLNSAALQLLGVDARTGAIDENDWFPLFPRIAALTEVQDGLEAAYRQTGVDAAALGVVGITDMEFGPGYHDWPLRFAAGLDQLRVRTATYADRLDEVVAAGLRTGQELDGGAGLLTMGPLKIISDGSLNTRTAHCCEPYADARTSDFPRGKQNTSPAELALLLERARQSGLEVALHAIGDAAVSIGLDAFAATGADGSIEHAQLMRFDDITRMARLGVRASVQPAHLLDDRDVTQQCWPDRADRCFPFQTMTRAGVELALGSDAPVAPLDPWLAMAAAVHRSADRREPWNPAEALTAAQALAASTDQQPTVGLGSRGDVVLLDADPLEPLDGSAAVGAHLRGVHVAATLVAGRPTHLEL